MDPTPMKTARDHSADMRKKHYFAYNSADGKTSGKHLKDLGLRFASHG